MIYHHVCVSFVRCTGEKSKKPQKPEKLQKPQDDSGSDWESMPMADTPSMKLSDWSGRIILGGKKHRGDTFNVAAQDRSYVKWCLSHSDQLTDPSLKDFSKYLTARWRKVKP